MLHYLKLYLIKNNKVELRKLYLYEHEVRNELIRIISRIFDAIDVDNLVDCLLSGAEQCHYSSFEIFRHVCEIHLFKLSPGTKDIQFQDLITIFDKYEVTHYNILHHHSDDDDDDEYYHETIGVRT